MKEGFAAHLIITPDTRYKSAIALVDENMVLCEIRDLDRETPFTRFYDGALMILRSEADPTTPGQEPIPGDRISVWHLYPYNLQERSEYPHTRKLKLR